MKKVFNITTHPQQFFSPSIGGVTIPVLGFVEIDKREAMDLVDAAPERFSVVDPSTVTKHHNKKES